MVGFPWAVRKRYGEDHGGWLGAIVTYDGFFALAPLLVVAMTFATAVFDDPSVRDRILEVVGDVLPFVGPDVQANLVPITGSSWAVGAGVVVALWGGLNAMRVAPGHDEPDVGRAALPAAWVGSGHWCAAPSSSSCWGSVSRALRSSPG